jgi:hypothetical protein
MPRPFEFEFDGREVQTLTNWMARAGVPTDRHVEIVAFAEAQARGAQRGDGQGGRAAQGGPGGSGPGHTAAIEMVKQKAAAAAMAAAKAAQPAAKHARAAVLAPMQTLTPSPHRFTGGRVVRGREGRGREKKKERKREKFLRAESREQRSREERMRHAAGPEGRRLGGGRRAGGLFVSHAALRRILSSSINRNRNHHRIYACIFGGLGRRGLALLQVCLPY